MARAGHWWIRAAGGAALFHLLAMMSPARAQDPTHYWSRCEGGGLSDIGNDIAIDAHGSVYVVGEFYGTGELAQAGQRTSTEVIT